MLALAEGDEQRLVVGEHQPRTEVAVAADLGQLLEDLGRSGQGVRVGEVELAAHHRSAGAASARLRIGQVYPGLPCGEVGIERHVEQAPLA